MAQSDRLYVVYLLTINGLPYIGQTCALKTRKWQHFGMLRRGNHFNPKMQAAVNRYGMDTVEFAVIESDIHWSDINERERYWISHYDAEISGLNQTKGSNTPCRWNGIDYPSLASAAKANAINTKQLRSWINAGFSCSDDIPKELGTNGKRCVWNSIEYSSISAAAFAAGIDARTLREYLKCGYTCESDVPKRSQSVKWNGVEYPSTTRAAIAYGCTVDQMRKWLAMGYSSGVDVALEKALREQECIETERERPPFPMFVSRKPKTQRANQTKERKRSAGYTGVRCRWNGIEYKSIKDAAAANGVTVWSMRLRFSQGYSCDDDMARIGGAIACTWNGVEYRSITDAARANNIDKTSMGERLKAGYTCDSDMVFPNRRQRKKAS